MNSNVFQERISGHVNYLRARVFGTQEDDGNNSQALYAGETWVDLFSVDTVRVGGGQAIEAPGGSRAR